MKTAFKRILNTSRYNEWLTWRVPMFITAALVVIESSTSHITWAILFQLALIFIGIFFGAVYVSLLNDFTDLEDDKFAGKSNRLQPLSPISRYLLLGLSIAIISYFAFAILTHPYPRSMYLAACISFFIYSVPPFRIKKKGAWGGIADALGASLFPILFVATQMSVYLDYSIPLGRLSAMGIWALTHGIRGILWHQYKDRYFDMSIGSRTFATDYNNKVMAVIEPMIVLVEITAFMLMLDHEILPLMFLLLAAHLALAFVTERLLGVHHIMVLSKPGKVEFMLFGTFYQTLCPIALVFLMSGISEISLLMIILLALMVLPDIRNNYYLVKKVIYDIPVIRAWWRKFNH